MMTAELPKVDMVIPVRGMTFEDPLTRNKYTQGVYQAHCSTPLIHAPDANYSQVISLTPDGFRISNLEEIEYLMQREEKLRAGGKSPREALNEPIFERHIRGDPYYWMHSNIALRAPAGKDIIPVESDGKGRKHGVVDYVIGNKVIATGVRAPVSRGGKVVALNPALRIPIDISDGNEPQHTTHWYFDPEHYDEKKEVAVLLDGSWYGGGHDRCLTLNARVGRSCSGSRASFRLFQGSLGEFQIPTVEYYVKDQESYERGLADGVAKGLTDGTVKGVRQERERIASELSAFLEKLKQ